MSQPDDEIADFMVAQWRNGCRRATRAALVSLGAFVLSAISFVFFMSYGFLVYATAGGMVVSAVVGLIALGVRISFGFRPPTR